MMLNKWNTNKYLYIGCYIGIILLMFIFNKYTYLMADDFTYVYSFADGQKIMGIRDIFSSMQAHFSSMNGRLTAHFFVQVFLFYAPWIFDVVNAAVFALFVCAISKYCFPEKEKNVLGLVLIFAVIWFFTPAFGQTMLWLDGACNYLWAVTFALWYLYPVVQLIKGKALLKKVWMQIGFVLLGFFMGGYLETVSFGVIFINVCLLAYMKIRQKQKISLCYMGSIMTMSAGFIVMMTGPGTLKNKVATGGMQSYVENFLNALEMYTTHLLYLVLFFIVLFVVAIKFKYQKINIYLSLVFFIASLATNFVHVVASYYPERNLLGSFVFLLIAIGVLIEDFWRGNTGIIMTCLCWIMLALSGIQILFGGWDVYSTYVQCMQRNEYIEKEKEKGNLNVVVPLIKAETKYSAQYGLKDLSKKKKDSWQNQGKAKYYGLQSILGKKNKSK